MGEFEQLLGKINKTQFFILKRKYEYAKEHNHYYISYKNTKYLVKYIEHLLNHYEKKFNTI
jgi:hypothetical protein